MPKLNQIIAIEKGVKSQAVATTSAVYKDVQKGNLFGGLSRTYLPLDDAGEKFPAESQRVQKRVGGVVDQFVAAMTELITVTARKDYTNCVATADVTIDGTILAAAVPVTNLLFLEKQMIDVRSFVSALPTLDEAEDWDFDPNAGLYKTAVVQTGKTKKVQKSLVLLEPTQFHPGKAEMVTEDVLVGNWSLTKLSGAIPGPVKLQVLARVEKLIIAVKEAREAANAVDEAKSPAMADAFFSYLFPSNWSLPEKTAT